MNRTWFGLVIILFAARLQAHHAFAAEYNEKKLVSVSGMVTRFTWSNPHAWLYVNGRDAEGKPVEWRFELGSPGGLQRRGWKRTDLKRGDPVTVDGYASKTHANIANARDVQLPDGRTLFGGFASTPGNPAK